MENPQPLSSLDVEAANITFDICLAPRHTSGFESRAHNHDIFCDDRCRVQSDLSVDEINFLVVFELQVDDDVLSKRWNRHASLCVQCNEPIAWRDIKDSLFAAVGPIRKATTR